MSSAVWTPIRLAAANSRFVKCIWTSGLDRLELPVAHGEGKFVPADESVRRALWDHDQVALVYTRPDGSSPQGHFPDNPNGTVDDIAAVCDKTGLVLGLMPHPERHISLLQHPAWTSRMSERGGKEEARGAGLNLICSAVEHVGGAVTKGR